MDDRWRINSRAMIGVENASNALQSILVSTANGARQGSVTAFPQLPQANQPYSDLTFPVGSSSADPRGQSMPIPDAAFGTLLPNHSVEIEIAPEPRPDLADVVQAHRNRRKGKQRALDEAFAAMRQGSALVPQLKEFMAAPIPGYKGPGFTFHPGMGYVCLVCGQLCPHEAQMGLHKTLEDGSGCVDLEPTNMLGNASMEENVHIETAAQTQIQAGAPLVDSRMDEGAGSGQVGRTHEEQLLYMIDGTMK